jgi:hypothetical protein
MGDVKERYMGQEKAGIVLLLAFGFNQRKTTEELQRRHPNLNNDPSKQRFVGRIHLRFDEIWSVSDKPRAGPVITSPDDKLCKVILVKIAVRPSRAVRKISSQLTLVNVHLDAQNSLFIYIQCIY